MYVEDVRLGRCFRFSAEEIRQVMEVDGSKVRAQPCTAQGGGVSVWVPLPEFAAEAECEVACPA